MAEPLPGIVFAKTAKGVEEIKARTVKLPREAGLVFLSVDGRSSVAELLPRSGMAPPQFYRTLEMLVADGYIEPAGTPPASFGTSAADATALRDSRLSPRGETVRASSTGSQAADAHRTKIVPAIDVSERARELKARVAAEHRAREEAGRKSREAAQLDVTAAPATPAHTPDTPPTLRADRAADGTTDAIPDDAVLRSPDVPEATPTARTDVSNRVEGRSPSSEAGTQRASGAPADTGRRPGHTDVGSIGSESLRIEGDRVIRERLNVDRAAYDLLAEAAQARRATESALQAHARGERAHDDADRALAARRAKRRRHIGLAAIVLFVGLPVLGVLALQFVPLTRYVPEVERALSEHLKQPVKLGSLRYVLLPTPRVVLQGLAIGPDADVRAERIEAHASPWALWARPVHFRTVDVRNAVIAPAALATLPSWLAGGGSDLRVSSLQLSNLRVDVPGAAIAPFNGEISFEPNGTIDGAVLANDNLKIRLTPGPQGADLRLDANAWTMPVGPPLQFSYFTAMARLSERELAIDEFTGRVAGGYVRATGTFRWPGPLVGYGSFALQSVRLEELLPALTPHVVAKGVLEAQGRYDMQADGADTLLASTRLDADFRISRGEIENLDLLRGFHTPGSTASRGGRTPFDKLTGTFHLSPAGYQYRQLRLSSGPFNANGELEVARNGKLSGHVNAELVVGTHVAARSAFEVGGTLTDPMLRR
jgi:hypothetical protein